MELETKMKFLSEFLVIPKALCLILSYMMFFMLIHVSEKATSAALQAEDWSLNLEICDIINETEDG